MSIIIKDIPVTRTEKIYICDYCSQECQGIEICAINEPYALLNDATVKTRHFHTYCVFSMYNQITNLKKESTKWPTPRKTRQIKGKDEIVI